MGKMQREKGRKFEGEIARMLKPLWPNARRGIGQARAGGEVPDVDGTPYWLELKHHKRPPSVHAAHAQGLAAHKASVRGGTAARHVVVVSRANLGPTLVTMPAEVWLELERLAALGRAAESAAHVSAARSMLPDPGP